jgi:hypothetical protein
MAGEAGVSLLAAACGSSIGGYATGTAATAGQGLNDNGGLWYVVHTDGTADTNAVTPTA